MKYNELKSIDRLDYVASRNIVLRTRLKVPRFVPKVATAKPKKAKTVKAPKAVATKAVKPKAKVAKPKKVKAKWREISGINDILRKKIIGKTWFLTLPEKLSDDFNELEIESPVLASLYQHDNVLFKKALANWASNAITSNALYLLRRNDYADKNVEDPNDNWGRDIVLKNVDLYDVDAKIENVGQFDPQAIFLWQLGLYKWAWDLDNAGDMLGNVYHDDAFDAKKTIYSELERMSRFDSTNNAINDELSKLRAAQALKMGIPQDFFTVVEQGSKAKSALDYRARHDEILSLCGVSLKTVHPLPPNEDTIHQLLLARPTSRAGADGASGMLVSLVQYYAFNAYFAYRSDPDLLFGQFDVVRDLNKHVKNLTGVDVWSKTLTDFYTKAQKTKQLAQRSA